MADKVVWFEVVGPDGAKLREFYGDLFGWSIDASNPLEYGIVDAKDSGVGGGIGASQDDKGHLMFYVGVDEPQAYLDRVEGMGGTVVMPLTSVPGMVTFAHVRDPAGHVFGIVDNAGPPPAE
jgi:predicted enzyme related to lactoylglutathione lyase